LSDIERVQGARCGCSSFPFKMGICAVAILTDSCLRRNDGLPHLYCLRTSACNQQQKKVGATSPDLFYI